MPILSTHIHRIIAGSCLIVLLSCCGGRHVDESADAAPRPDTAMDTAFSDGPAGWTFLPSNLPADTLTIDPPGSLVLDGVTCAGASMVVINTDDGTMAACSGAVEGMNYRFVKVEQAGGGPLAVVIARSITIAPGMVISVQGQRPLVLIALDDVMISGALNAAGEGERNGAGGGPGIVGMRGNGSGPGAGRGDGIGGGGGGSYCGRGGVGGSGNPAGPLYGNPRVVPLLGGSSGGNAGPYSSGGGGGAIQIVAGKTIRIAATGFIHVGGGGGEREGAGGGSGGAILLEAPMVTVGGLLAANGGGGASSGKFGENATPDDQPAQGGAAAAEFNTGEGGNGAAGLMLDGTNGQINPTYVNGEITGGGGGGAGFIRINTRSATVTSRLSPSFGTPCSTQGRLN